MKEEKFVQATLTWTL